MKKPFRDVAPDAEFDRQLAGLCDGTLSEEEHRALAAKLESDPAARREYLAYLDLHACLLGEQAWVPPSRLSEMNCGIALTSPVETRQAARVHAPWGLIGATAAAVLIASGLFLTRQHAPAPIAQSDPAPAAVPHAAITLGILAEVSGTVEWLDPLGNLRIAKLDDPLPAGHTLRTGPDDSLAVLHLNDGTRLELSPAGQLRLPETDGRSGGWRFVLAAGLLQADVKPRPKDSPLLVVTPQAEVVVLGTRFTVSAAEPAATGVATESGLVRVVRTADGRSAEVPAGHYVVASEDVDSFEVRPSVDLPTEPRASLAFERARSMAYTPDGRWLTVASSQRWTSLDAVSGAARFPPQPVPAKAAAVIVSADGSRLLVSERDTKFQFAEGASGELLGSWNVGHTGHYIWATNQDARFVSCGHIVSGPPNLVSVWDTQADREVAALKIEATALCVALSGDGRFVAAGLGRNRGLREYRLAVWDTTSRQRLATIVVPEQALQVLAFSPDGRQIVGATLHGCAYVWDTTTGQQIISRIAADGWTQPIRSLAFSPGGKRLALGTSNGRVRLWDLSHDEDLGMLVLGTRIVSALAFSPDGRTLAACTVGGPITLWDMP